MDRTLARSLGARARVGEGGRERSNEQRFKSFMTVAVAAEIHASVGEGFRRLFLFLDA